MLFRAWLFTRTPAQLAFSHRTFPVNRLCQADRKLEAAKQKRRKAAADAASPETDATSPETATAVDTRSGGTGNSRSKGGSDGGSSGELRVTQVGKKPVACGTKTKAGDLIEFRCKPCFRREVVLAMIG